MRELLVVVLAVRDDVVRAVLAEVDRPGAGVREVLASRGGELAGDVVALLARLSVADLGPRLLALAVAADDDVAGRADLLRAMTDELPAGWGLPAALPVVSGSATAWSAAGAAAVGDPLVAGAVLAAAAATGAHAHLPRTQA